MAAERERAEAGPSILCCPLASVRRLPHPTHTPHTPPPLHTLNPLPLSPLPNPPPTAPSPQPARTPFPSSSRPPGGSCCREGEWQDVEIPLQRFLLTWRGKLVETRVEMNPRRVISLGISLAGGSELQPEGPFRLGLRAILARNSGAYRPGGEGEKER